MYQGNVLEVLIASPSDTEEQRLTIRDSVIAWNRTNARHLGVVSLPIMWETHAFPELGAPPQSILNDQIVDDADILIATFWTKLGTPTPAAPSGTVEEIERFVTAGKPALVYFCTMSPRLADVDPEAIDAVRTYQDQLRSRGLYIACGSLHELAMRVREDLTSHVHDMLKAGSIQAAPENAPDRAAQPAKDAAASDAFAPLREFLLGYVAKWQSELSALDAVEMPNIDRRHDLIREVQTVLLEVQRRVATIDPDAPILSTFVQLVSDTAKVLTMRVYIDGGRSFNALLQACHKVLDTVQELARDANQWAVNSEGVATA